MKSASSFARAMAGMSALAAAALGGCASPGARDFFAVPALAAGNASPPGRAEFFSGEAIILVAGGDGFEGRVARPAVFRVGALKPLYVGSPVVMTGEEVQWWSLGTLEPGKYFVELQIDGRRWRHPLLISVVP